MMPPCSSTPPISCADLKHSVATHKGRFRFKLVSCDVETRLVRIEHQYYPLDGGARISRFLLDGLRATLLAIVPLAKFKTL